MADPAISFDLTPAEQDQIDSSLPHLAHSVLDLYRELLLLCSAGNAHDGQDAQIQRLVDQFGRLRVWTEQTGATLETTGSLQDTLQHDLALRTSVSDVLLQLTTLISTAISMSSNPESSRLIAGQDAGGALTSDSEYSADSEQADPDSTRPRPRISRFSLILSHIFEQIGLLYHYSAIFRRPRLRGRYLHSKSQDPYYQIPYYEYSHVQQKLQDWASRGSAAGQQSGEDARIEFTAQLDVLCMRIAAANARRREQLRHWAKHPIAEDADDEDEPAVERKAVNFSPSEAASRLSRPTTVSTGFSSVARSAIYETETQVGPSRTVYAPSELGGGDVRAAKVPKLPAEASKSPTFECPFCRMTLQSAPMQDRNAWKRHVYRDLRPYVCTFAQCSNPDKLYATRREWAYHEFQMHRRQWNCRLCSTSYESKELMASHLRSRHSHHWEERQLATVLEVSEVPIEGGQKQACPICDTRMPVSSLMAHIADHMEQLALFVLPNDNDDMQEEPSSGALSSLDSDEDHQSDQFREVPIVPTATTTKPPDRFKCDICGHAFNKIERLK